MPNRAHTPGVLDRRPRRREGLESDTAFVRGSALIRDAYRFAKRAHADQREETGGGPYIEHPVAVARLLREAGFSDRVVAAGLLHDVVEDTEVELASIEQRFGRDVAALVDALTEPEDVTPFEAQKAAHREQIARAGREAEAIFAADKVVNASTLRLAIARLGRPQVEARVSKPLDKKLEHYQATLELLEDVEEDLEMLPQLREELEALNREQARDEADRIAHAAADALNALDAEALVDITDPGVAWFPALTFGERGGAYRGHAGIRRYVDDLSRLWREVQIEVLQVRRDGDKVVAICETRAEGRVSRRGMARRSATVYWLDRGRVVCARTYA